MASDHAGFEYKQAIASHLKQLGHEVRDLGTHSPDPVDYPDWIRPAVLAVESGECQRGIVLGGSGIGEAIVANRVKGIRCAQVWDLQSARLSRTHNDANMISLGQRLVDLQTALAIVDEWLAREFEGGRHVRRIQKIDEPG